MRRDARTHCKDCGIILNESNTVWVNSQSRQPRCHTCHKIYDRERARVARTTDAWKNTRYKLLYGTTNDEYNKLMESHLGGCAICKQPCESGKKLSVDHNHETGEVRGLLCLNCNLAIGLLKEDEILLWNAMEYLKRTTWKKDIA